MRGKAIHEQYVRQIEDKGKYNRKSNFKERTKAFSCSTQEQTLRTNYVKFCVGKTSTSPLCRMCRMEKETVSHIVSPKRNIKQK